jgi:hypothetical protein
MRSAVFPSAQVACLNAALLLAACATTTPAAKPPLAATADNSACMTPTASRIPAAKGSCSGTGHIYTADDVNRTGATTAGDALRLLSPSLTISH